MLGSAQINITVLIRLILLLLKGRIKLSLSIDLEGLLLGFHTLECNLLCRLNPALLELLCFHRLRSRSLLEMVNGFLGFKVGRYNVK